MKFALISEGASEHKIVKNIIERYFSDQDPLVTMIQPMVMDGKQVQTGGWVEVIKYCRSEKLEDILIENNFLIIQIDTDQCQNHPFSVTITPIDNTKTIYTKVIEKLSSFILPEIYEKYLNRIIFAVCIDTIECWLIPIYYRDNRRSKESNCIKYLNMELVRKNITPINPNNKNTNNSNATYDIILKNWRKKSSLLESAIDQYSLNEFINNLNLKTNIYKNNILMNIVTTLLLKKKETL